jgi:RNA polymerase sigma-70 factor (ECF subfamily)
MQSDEELAAAFEAGRSAWPGIALTYTCFANRMRELGVPPADLALRGRDLYLAAACAEGDPTALRCFDEQFIARIDGMATRFGLGPNLLDEVRQKVRVKLLVGKSPSIARYRGGGPLLAWVRVTAARVAVDVAAAARLPEPMPEEEMLDVLVSREANPEIETVKALYRERFQEALEASLAGLTTRDKTLLRLHLVDGLNIDGIGAIYRVHRATVARWLVAIRARVFAGLRQRFALGAEASTSQMRSLVRIFRDDIQLSAKRLLGPEG